jgi:hypothetical protein
MSKVFNRMGYQPFRSGDPQFQINFLLLLIDLLSRDICSSSLRLSFSIHFNVMLAYIIAITRKTSKNSLNASNDVTFDMFKNDKHSQSCLLLKLRAPSV